MRGTGPSDGEHQVLSASTIRLWAIGLIITAGAAVVALLLLFRHGSAQDSVQLDAIRTAGSIVVGTGGAAALLLTARRQRSTELDLRQKDHDATERRVTELYGKAADQLGSDKAPVRLAGLYALERLAQDNPAHRQTIVNLICAYLRMPFEPPETGRSEESEVRRVAQQLLITHLRPGSEAERPNPIYWSDIDLNLADATLVRFNLTHALLRSAVFQSATFLGPTTFRGTTIERAADFRYARFADQADFRRVVVGAEDRIFLGAMFDGPVNLGIHTKLPIEDAIFRSDGRNQPARSHVP